MSQDIIKYGTERARSSIVYLVWPLMTTTTTTAMMIMITRQRTKQIHRFFRADRAESTALLV